MVKIENSLFEAREIGYTNTPKSLHLNAQNPVYELEAGYALYYDGTRRGSLCHFICLAEF